MNIWACDYKRIYFHFDFEKLFTCRVRLEERHHSAASGGVSLEFKGKGRPLGLSYFHMILRTDKKVVL